MIVHFNFIVFKLKVQMLMVEALGVPKFVFLLSWLIREYTLKEKKVWRHNIYVMVWIFYRKMAGLCVIY